MDWIWIGFGFNISQLNRYGLDLVLELSPSGTSAYNRCILKFPHRNMNDAKYVQEKLDKKDEQNRKQYLYCSFENEPEARCWI